MNNCDSSRQSAEAFTLLLEVARRKNRFDATNPWCNGSVTYFEEIRKELRELEDELPGGRRPMVEEELGDVLWDYLNILLCLEGEGRVGASNVLERAAAKYGERISGIESGLKWKDIKERQKLRLEFEDRIRISKYEPVMTREIADLFHASVHGIEDIHYTPEQREAWAPTPPDYDGWSARLQAKTPWVATVGGRVAGFIELDPDGHIDCMYTHPDFQGCGIASALYSCVESHARTVRMDTLRVEASRTARSFFERNGFILVRENLVIMNGSDLRNFIMEKRLSTHPRLETPRAVMRFPLPSEAAAALDYFTRNCDHLARTMPAFAHDFFTLPYWERRLAANVAEFEAGSSCRMFILPLDPGSGGPGRVIGTVSFTQISRGVHQACMLGYGIDRDWQGRGLMTECLAGAIKYAFSSDGLNIHKIDANYMPWNAASGRVLDKLGFEQGGIAREELFLDGRWQDHVRMRLANPGWRART